MTCPFHSGESDGTESEAGPGSGANGTAGDGRRRDRGVSRRSFVQSALLIGGSGALSGLADATGLTPTTSEDAAERRASRAARRNRQHAWDAYEETVATGNTVQPASSLILLLDYRGSGEPAPGHRRQVARALDSLEDHFEWSHRGLLFTIGYSASYFDRFDEGPPAGAAPWSAERVVEESSAVTPYDPEPDEADAVVLLASDNPANTLAAEAALWGEAGDGVPELDATFEGVFEKPESWPKRRVGEGGPEFQDKEEAYEEFVDDDAADIPDESPLSMGFVAGFGDSIPAEDAVTLERGQRFPGADIDADEVPTDLPYVGEVGERDPGVFAQGTLKHLSYLTIDLDEWYSNDRERRRHQMYSPYHEADETTDNAEKPGSGLVDGDGDDEPDRPTGPGTEGLVAREDGTVATDEDDTVYGAETPASATEGTDRTDGEPTVAHSQKASRARYDIDGDGELEQPCLRRDWDGIRPPENGYERRAGYHFNVPMRFNESILTLLDANYGPEFRSLDGAVDHSDVGAADVTTGDGERNGLVPFMEATRRNNWLVPPITLRALPYPRAVRATITVEGGDGVYTVEVEGLPEGTEALNANTARFGAPEEVNQARGAESTDVSRGRTTTLEFPADETTLSAGDTAKLFVKTRGTRRPVVGVVESAGTGN